MHGFSLLTSLIAIILIDLSLSGDNAAIIGLAIRELPPKLARRAAFVGASGAIAVRVAFTAAATLMMKVRYLNAIGGVILIWLTTPRTEVRGFPEARALRFLLHRPCRACQIGFGLTVAPQALPACPAVQTLLGRNTQESEPFRLDVLSGVHVPVMDHAAFWAGPPANEQRHLIHLVAADVA